MTYDRTDTTINTPVPFLLDDSLYTVYESLVSRLGKLGIFNHLCPVFHIYLSVFFLSPSFDHQIQLYDISPPLKQDRQGKYSGESILA